MMITSLPAAAAAASMQETDADGRTNEMAPRTTGRTQTDDGTFFPNSKKGATARQRQAGGD